MAINCVQSSSNKIHVQRVFSYIILHIYAALVTPRENPGVRKLCGKVCITILCTSANMRFRESLKLYEPTYLAFYFYIGNLEAGVNE